MQQDVLKSVPASSKEKKTSRILIVDDDESKLDAVTLQLSRLMPEAEILTAGSGREGLDKARLCEPDVILLDLVMPEMDGVEVCRRLRESDEVDYIPVIMMTGAKTRSKERVEALDNGVDVFLNTPIQPGELAAQVKAMLRLKRMEERSFQEEKIRKKKELLLREIHHRIKNNLSTISSLLNLQSGYVGDEKSKQAFKESRKRIQAIALIHEKLYKSTEISHVQFGHYLKDLVHALINSYSIPDKEVELKLDADTVYFNIETSIPLGLILTELTTNALKYGFPVDGQPLVLTIRLKDRDETIELSVSDNGPGIDESVDWKNTGTLGLQLVIMLVEQLEGSVKMDSKTGAAFTICFPRPQDSV